MKMMVLAPGLLLLLVGCGSQNPGCGVGSLALAVAPLSGTADHTSAAPGNQVQFHATSAPSTEGPNCATPNTTPDVIALVNATWTVSDTLHVKISSAADATNGLATCLGPTTGAATVTGTVGSGASLSRVTASLTCK